MKDPYLEPSPTAYILANWERLTRFVEDAQISLDNNATERGIRDPVWGGQESLQLEVSSRDRGRRHALHELKTRKLHGKDSAANLYATTVAGDRGSVLTLALQRGCLSIGQILPAIAAARMLRRVARWLTYQVGGRAAKALHCTTSSIFVLCHKLAYSGKAVSISRSCR